MNVIVASMLAVCLNGSWNFCFNENRTIEDGVDVDKAQWTTMPVPGCWDVMPQWWMKRGTGCYRRSFELKEPMKDGVLIVEGIGIRGRFAVDGKDLGLFVTPYARLEIPVGTLAAGVHTIEAQIDNTLGWPRVKMARPYYDFYFYGGFYHGVKLVEKEPKVFVRTVDYQAKKVKVMVEGGEWKEMTLPEAKLWSPEAPNLTTIEVEGRKVRFGLRQIEARGGRLYLNGKELFLKGFNRHESSPFEGAATGDATMLRDIQNLKACGGNFFRCAHYQQSERFLDLCDEYGVLVWEESLGWGNGQDYTNNSYPPNEFNDPEFCELQVKQTREMVRASYNHPSVIIYAFLNECGSHKKECKALVDQLIETIRKEDTGRLISFACNVCDKDICHENTDLVAFNSYPGTIPAKPGTPAELRKEVKWTFDKTVKRFRKAYPDKPIIVSESGCGGLFGLRDDNASINTEDYQNEYLVDIMDALWTNPDVSGFAIWQMNDGRTRERFSKGSCSTMFGGSIAGCFDIYRRPKSSVAIVKKYFSEK